ncbi:hypothetical protein [Flavobacterium caeni]|uniref:Uncharacterized protein n=1 Tax=Flavobacterium caeni TaxID=490189 RepID=A0A1G5GW89_9FLAO|nr:hypothetical protein [Flavobacterium caeni]SCY55862.1 hypothetical protein SAMN02927903_01656 [Flavobacterium caeni]
MKTFLSALLGLCNSGLFAIHIHNVQITPIDLQTVNVSLTTEAEELYYFDSWNYVLAGNVLTVNAFFIEGFGSTIAYLNNNFAVPLSVPQQYTVIIRVFYTNTVYAFKTLKDMVRIPYRHPRRLPEVLRG